MTNKQDSYNFRQNLQFTTEKPNFIKLLNKQHSREPQEKDASNYTDEAPQIELGKGVTRNEANTFIQKGKQDRPDKIGGKNSCVVGIDDLMNTIQDIKVVKEDVVLVVDGDPTINDTNELQEDHSSKEVKVCKTAQVFKVERKKRKQLPTSIISTTSDTTSITSSKKKIKARSSLLSFDQDE